MDTRNETTPCHSLPAKPRIGKFTLENASSAVDFLVAIRDIVLAMKHMFVEHRILHRHIAYNNVLVQSTDDGGIKGLVVDLDFPNPAEGSSHQKSKTRLCNTFLFQSHRDLHGYGKRGVHNAIDDLQSVFYTLCWACYGFDHTGLPDKFRPLWMEDWVTGQFIWYAEPFGTKKRELLLGPMPSHVNRYMGCHRDIIEGVIEEQKKLLIKRFSDDALCYDAILETLQDGIGKLQGEPCGLGGGCSKATTPPRIGAARGNLKRRLCEGDIEGDSRPKKRPMCKLTPLEDNYSRW
ncbi:hypothetical protein B0H15DRAFT_857905 [Mycena belliarum]|uniref:Fungal-type protein kinase domain-containing protein n=1 Tax=Mycena belliarum TaxID=1033014 RepID=A0AAD6XJV1_9AGAR|nr:hypothetical protein B0H15DRAFT_857905 [Mycena belliae]